MKQFYVDTQGVPELSELLQKKAFEAGYKQFSAPAMPPYPFFVVGFGNSNEFCHAKNSIFGERFQYTVPQALKYFSELKAEKEKPVYKVGDWVTILDNDNCVPKEDFPVGSTHKIYDLKEGIVVLEDSFSFAFGRIRHATPDEISAAQKIFIGGYEVEFSKKRFDGKSIRIEGRSYTYHYVHQVKALMKQGDIKALIFHDCSGEEIKVDYETVQKITERLK